MSNRKKKLLSIIGIMALFLILVGVSYATWLFTGTGIKENVINVGKIDISYRENTRVTLDGVYPESDAVGIATTRQNSTVSFDIISDIRGEQTINYAIALDEITEGATLTEKYIKIYVLKDGYLVNGFETNVGKTIEEFAPYSITNKIEDHVILTDSITGQDTHNYTIKAWVSNDYILPIDDTSSDAIHSNEANSETFSFKIKVVASDESLVITASTLDTSNANIPELVQGMIPVYYDGTNWKKADSTNLDENHKWYDYNDKMWANVVTVTETNRATITSAPLGTPISMDDINTMWVWIPRYSYTINDTAKGTNTGTDSKPLYLTPGAIDIKFINTNTVETGTAQYNGATATNYYTHPSFWWDSDDDGVRDANEEKAGIWFAKFETSHNTLASSIEFNNLECTNTSCANGSGIIIKPDVKGLNFNDISNLFLGARSMQIAHYDTYGFPNDSTYDIHMIKNDEWGAVSYLTQSIYGKCTSATSCTEVYENDSKDYYTGRSIGNVYGSTPYHYHKYGSYTYDGYLLELNTNTKSSTRDMSKVASTTGNTYGIYDMSGGLSDYVMGNFNDISGGNEECHSGFNGILYYDEPVTTGIDFFGITSNNKYYNKYADPPFNGNYVNGNYENNIENCTQETCGGHALNETLGWYKNYSEFLHDDCAWLVRLAELSYYFCSDGGIDDGYYGAHFAIVK